MVLLFSICKELTGMVWIAAEGLNGKLSSALSFNLQHEELYNDFCFIMCVDVLKVDWSMVI